ncbi:hypothetical protein GCM10012280_70280 [Wenjunlia tyrosinilytica]|uniref:Uncharacterized protein n=1 Tax=Wenjunlia tyrosinilytica TaxID=1544741 RepID=A0A917ZY33_9ACTN|nr:hypothetical protein GCM10012280_70280 [Wenjunlia tyrosinilytica]
MSASILPKPAGGQTPEPAIVRAVELKRQAIYPAEILVLQPLEQALLKLLWLLPTGTPFGISGVVDMVRQLQWRTGNRRVAGTKAVRAALHAIASAGWIAVSQGRRPDGTVAAQAYVVFEDRGNNPAWSGTVPVPPMELMHVTPPAPSGEAVTVQPVDKPETPGGAICPNAARRNAGPRDEPGGPSDVSAGHPACPDGAVGITSLPPHPPGGGGTPPPPPSCGQRSRQLRLRSGARLGNYSSDWETHGRNWQSADVISMHWSTWPLQRSTKAGYQMRCAPTCWRILRRMGSSIPADS